MTVNESQARSYQATPKVLDPACGAGHILVPTLRVMSALEPEKPLSALIARLYGCDIDPHVVEVCRATVMLEALRRGPCDVVALWECVRQNIRSVAAPFGSLERHSSDELLQRTYDCVITNPPYVGRRKLDETTRLFLDREYPDTSMDLCAAFIERCIDLACPGGSLGLVTSDKWLRLKGYERLRTGGRRFAGVYQALSLDVLCELGPRAFTPQSRLHDGMGAMLLTARRAEPPAQHSFMFISLAGLNSFAEKSAVFSDKSSTLHGATHVLQERVCVAGSSVNFLSQMAIPSGLEKGAKKLGEIAEVVVGLQTNDDRRLVRYVWSVPPDPTRWKIHSKGGGYGRWYGFNRYLLDWANGRALFEREPKSGLRVERWFEKEGWTYTWFANGALGVRKKERGWSIGRAAAAGIFCDDSRVVAFLNSRLASRMARSLGGKAQLPEGVTRMIPVPESLDEIDRDLVEAAVRIKQEICSYDLTEISFVPRKTWDATTEFVLSLLLLIIEGELERQVLRACGTTAAEEGALNAIFGVPVAWLEGGSPELEGHFWAMVPAQFRPLRDRIECVAGRSRAQSSSGCSALGGKPPIGTRPLGVTMDVERLCREREAHPFSLVGDIASFMEDKGVCSINTMSDAIGKRILQEVLSLLGHQWWSESRQYRPGTHRRLHMSAGVEEVLSRMPDNLRERIGTDAVSRWMQGPMVTWAERRFFGESPFVVSSQLGDKGGTLHHRWEAEVEPPTVSDLASGIRVR